MVSLTKFLIFAILGIAALFAGLLVPAHVRSVDRAVLQVAAENGTDSRYTFELFTAEALVGPAVIFAEGTGIRQPRSARDRIAGLIEQYPQYKVTGGPEPYTESFLDLIRFDPARDAPEGIIPFLVPEVERQSLLGFLRGSSNANVHALLDARVVHGLTKLRPATSGAGAPYDAAILTIALLVQGGHVESEMAASLAAIARLAVSGERSAVEAIEDVALSIITLGRRLDMRQLAAVVAVCETPEELVEAAGLVRNRPDDLPVFVSSFIMSGRPEEVAAYLDGPDGDRFGDLSIAVAMGEGAVGELLERDLPVYKPNQLIAPLLDFIAPYRPPKTAAFALLSPSSALAVRFGLLVLAGLFCSFALGVLWRAESVAVRLKRGNPIVMFRDGLTALVFSVICWALIEPDILRAVGDSTEPGVRLEFAAAGTLESLESPLKSMQEPNQVTLLVLALFFVLQLVIYALCLIRVKEINKQNLSSELKLKLLENEDYLFDFGLYIGLGGTVGSLILVAIGIVEASLMAAYASTLFGILFVALLKIFHVRPFRRKLIMAASNEMPQPQPRVPIPTPDDLMKDAVL